MTEQLLVDTMLGSLTTYLRMCGYDAVYALDEDLEEDEEIAAFAHEEGRTLLTRDTDLAPAEHAVLIQSTDIEGQLVELIEVGFDLEFPTEPRRCSNCNGTLEALPAGESTPDDAPDPDEQGVWKCTDCGQLFWKGSHWDAVARRFSGLGEE